MLNSPSDYLHPHPQPVSSDQSSLRTSSQTSCPGRNNNDPRNDSIFLTDITKAGLEGPVLESVLRSKSTGIDDDEANGDDEIPDGGRGWLVVFGCLIVAAVVMGWPYARIRLLPSGEACFTDKHFHLPDLYGVYSRHIIARQHIQMYQILFYRS